MAMSLGANVEPCEVACSSESKTASWIVERSRSAPTGT